MNTEFLMMTSEDACPTMELPHGSARVSLAQNPQQVNRPRLSHREMDFIMTMMETCNAKKYLTNSMYSKISFVSS